MIVLASLAALVVVTAIVARAATRTSVGEQERTAALTAELKAAVTAADRANRDGLARVVAAAGARCCGRAGDGVELVPT